jgi:hypothetical protein
VNRRTPATLAGLAALVPAIALASPGAHGKAEDPAGGTTAQAWVFLPNPVQTTGDQTLTDQKDSATAVPAGAYYLVELTNLDGSGRLVGDWANVRAETGDPARETDGTFFYTRDDDRFEQVMGYFWITEAQKYLQHLGFGSDLPAVNAESQDLRINQYGIDNSFSWDKKDLIRLGKGGVDDAEDGEVIVHEYGHAVHDAQGFGATSLEAGAIGEAFGDYLAVTVGDYVMQQHGVTSMAPLGCVADWDAVSYTSRVPHCLRRVDTNRHYPENAVGGVHTQGMIWSRALWDIHNALGATTADRIIVNAQFDFATDTSFADAAVVTVDTAEEMYGDAEAAVVQQAFEDRGIL